MFDETHIRGHLGDSSRELSEAAIEYLQEVEHQPFFLWVHYFDPHYDFVPHEEFPAGDQYGGPLPASLSIERLRREIDSLTREDVQYIHDVYDAEISYTDLHIGKLLAALEVLGISGRTLVAVTADHGEEFLERGRIGHGKNTYHELIRVPLILYDPAQGKLGGTRVESPVEIRSVGGSLLEAVGISPRGFAGPNLFRLAVGTSQSTPAFSEGSYAWGSDQRRLALITEKWKLIRNFDDQSYELYNLENDPGEQRNLVDTRPAVLDDLVPALQARLGAQGKEVGEPVRLSNEEHERLKSLGYIQ